MGATTFVNDFRQDCIHFGISLVEWLLLFVAIFGVVVLLQKLCDRLQASVGTAGIYGALFALAFVVAMFDGGYLRTHIAGWLGSGR